MNHSTKSNNRHRAGFTLIEIVAAMALSALILGGIFQCASACFQLSSSVVQKGQQEMHAAAFFDLMRRNFSSMPGNGKLTVTPLDGLGSASNTELVMKDYPLAFSWGGVAAGSEKVLIVSEKDPLGGTQIRIRYLNEEESLGHEEGNLAADEGQSLVLISGIKSMYWQFFDQTEEEWVEEWEEEGRRPSLIELNIEFYSLEEPVRSVFWIPVVANPESVVRGAQQGGATANPQPTGGNGGGGPGGGGSTGGDRGDRPSRSGNGGSQPSIR